MAGSGVCQKENGEGSELLTCLKSAVQNAEDLVRKNVGLNKEIERLKKENELVHGKFEIEASGRLKLQSECEGFKVLISRLRKERDGFEENENYYHKEIIKLQRKICEGEKLKELNSRLREERDGLCKRLKEKEDDHKEIIELKNEICELKINKLRAENDADVYHKRFKELEGKVLIMNVEKDAETNSGKRKGSEEKTNPNVGSSHVKPTGGKSNANTKSSKLSVIKKPCKPVKKIRAVKDPNEPKRPPSPFFVFMEEFRQTYKKEHPENKCAIHVGIAGGDKWKALSADEKASFVAVAEKRKVEYEKKLIAYYKNRDREEDEVDKSESEVNDDEDGDDEEETDNEPLSIRIERLSTIIK